MSRAQSEARSVFEACLMRAGSKLGKDYFFLERDFAAVLQRLINRDGRFLAIHEYKHFDLALMERKTESVVLVAEFKFEPDKQRTIWKNPQFYKKVSVTDGKSILYDIEKLRRRNSTVEGASRVLCLIDEGGQYKGKAFIDSNFKAFTKGIYTAWVVSE